MSQSTFSFTKLAAPGDQPHPAGKWGIAAWDASPEPKPGDTVQVGKRDGTYDKVILGPEVWRKSYKSGTKIVFAIKGRPGEAPRKQAETRQITVTEPGVYETDDGIFIVKPNREKTRLYAKRLIDLRPTQGDRMNEPGDAVRIEFEYEAGAIYTIKPEDKMPLERAKELTVLYGHCIVCGAKLEVKESVERGIGPVCIKSFAGSDVSG